MNKGKLNTFNLDFTSEEDDEVYKGQFTSRKLSIMDHSKVQRRRNELNGGHHCVTDDDGNFTGVGMDPETDYFHYMIAVLEVCLIQKPSWWDFDTLYDRSVVMKVFSEVMTFENSFRKRRRGTAQESNTSAGSQGNSTKEPEEPLNDHLPQKVVGKEVQASLDA